MQNISKITAVSPIQSLPVFKAEKQKNTGFSCTIKMLKRSFHIFSGPSTPGKINICSAISYRHSAGHNIDADRKHNFYLGIMAANVRQISCTLGAELLASFTGPELAALIEVLSLKCHWNAMWLAGIVIHCLDCSSLTRWCSTEITPMSCRSVASLALQRTLVANWKDRLGLVVSTSYSFTAQK